MLRASSLGLQFLQADLHRITKRWALKQITALKVYRSINYARRKRHVNPVQPTSVDGTLDPSHEVIQEFNTQPTPSTTSLSSPIFEFPITITLSGSRPAAKLPIFRSFSLPPQASVGEFNGSQGRGELLPKKNGGIKSKGNVLEQRPGLREAQVLGHSDVAGRSWRRPQIKKLEVQPSSQGMFEHPKRSASPCRGVHGYRRARRRLLWILAKTSSANAAWGVYSELLSHPLPEDRPVQGCNIPFAHLHRLCRVLARKRPKTREVFMRLLSVLAVIHNANGTIYLHEWNTLIDSAGKGWRKTRSEDYKLAYSLYRDMVEGKAPGTHSTLYETLQNPANYATEQQSRTPIKPDIYTYNILINLAAHTLDGPSVHHAFMLLQSSGLRPTRLTQLSLLTYYASTSGLNGVREILQKMQTKGMVLGLDGINACIWVHGLCGNLGVVRMIYRLLRHNLHPESNHQNELEEVRRQLELDENIVISGTYRPNIVTFTTMIQVVAYHGDFLATLNIFTDMLGAENWEPGAPFFPGKGGQWHRATYPPSLSVFRGIFLGFSRHAVPPPSTDTYIPLPPRSSALFPSFPPSSLSSSTYHPPYHHHSYELDTSMASAEFQTPTPSEPTWTLQNLETLFAVFLTCITEKPSRSMIHWIMVAFDRASGHNVDLLRRVWNDLERVFNGPFAGPTNRLRKWQRALFPGKY